MVEFMVILGMCGCFWLGWSLREIKARFELIDQAEVCDNQKQVLHDEIDSLHDALRFARRNSAANILDKMGYDRPQGTPVLRVVGGKDCK